MMISLTSSRLKIIPLTLPQFALLLKSRSDLEKELGLTISGEQLNQETQEAMEWLYDQAQQHSKDYLWYTNWQIIDRAENRAVGSLCFIGAPNEKGDVTIGYGTDEAYQNQGIMTEAVKEICNWTFQQKGVKTILAESDADNQASHRVLQKCGFEQLCSETETQLWRRQKGN